MSSDAPEEAQTVQLRLDEFLQLSDTIQLISNRVHGLENRIDTIDQTLKVLNKLIQKQAEIERRKFSQILLQMQKRNVKEGTNKVFKKPPKKKRKLGQLPQSDNDINGRNKEIEF